MIKHHALINCVSPVPFPSSPPSSPPRMPSSPPPFRSSSTRISSSPVSRPLPATASRPSHRPFLLSSLCEMKHPSSLRHSRPSSPWRHFRVSIGAPRTRRWISSPPNLCSKNESSEVTDAGDMMAVSSDSDEIKSESKSTKAFSFNETMQKLKRYGVAGVLSYGLLNTIYYLITFFLVWFYFAPAPGNLGYAAAVERFLKLMAMVWAGSQVTKIVRAGGALALAPFVDRGLSWFTVKFKFKSRGKAFAAIAGLCFCLALLVFFGLTILWA